MPIPRVAIVGRPNVGKSSLINLIAGAKVSIVDPTPGVTRDRVSAIVDLMSPDGRGPLKPVEFVDTGGFGVYVAEGERYDEVGNDLAKLTESIEFQIAQAVEGADVVLFAVDTQAGITAHDKEIARLLRERALGGKRRRGPKGEAPGKAKKADSVAPARDKGPMLRLVATKTDGPKWEPHAMELAGLGFGDPLPVSAKSNYFRRDFLDAIYKMLPEPQAEQRDQARPDLAVAIIGKRNSGKSTLVNTLAGEPRVIVSEIPGTTRDAVDVRFDFGDKSIVAIDTAGLRRKRSFQNMIEHFAFDRVQRAVDRADVVLLLLDATEKISQVDEQLAMLVQKAYKPVVIVVNKWDLAEGQYDDKGRQVSVKRYEEYIRAELRGLPFAPISFISGQEGRNVKATMRLAMELREQSATRVTTGRLNRLVRAIMETRAPTDTKGTFAKIYYVAQTGVEPPTITMVVNKPDLFRPNYLRFLMNRFREELPYSEVPVRIVVRARRQREDDLFDGADQPARIARGRKGVYQRLGQGGSKPVPVSEEFGEELLDDALSEPVDIDVFSDNADDYFEEEKTRTTKTKPKVKKK
ncbi:MAG: ribosome biogenesis GTPase Der [Planctomycetes bacterium]|nr:ribosome biogenesis GTPase Der [Planctomycetota bacterium]